jgi:hypothetical protein
MSLHFVVKLRDRRKGGSSSRVGGFLCDRTLQSSGKVPSLKGLAFICNAYAGLKPALSEAEGACPERSRRDRGYDCDALRAED